ncbi:MAG: TAXI family TRAP transporter solute-binding subunit [Oscillospiraceae bacterium]|nr:TAXI family TRAP transporter solute-binding subunit [Oscillospiraceae bacterium]
MKKILCLALSILMVLSLAGCSGKTSAPAAPQNTAAPQQSTSNVDGYVMRLGTDAVGGTANTALEAMSAVVNQNTKLKTSTVVTTGAVEIINLINSGELEGGYAGTINLIQALNGEAPFSGPIPMEAMTQGFGFVSWMLPIITTKDKGITTYEELAGKTVAFPQQGSASAEVMKILFDCYDLTDKVKIEYFGWSDAWEALKDGRVDAACGSWANGLPAAGVVELCTTRDIVILPMSEEIGQKLNGINNGIAFQGMTHENDASIPEGEVRYAARNSGVCVFAASADEEAVYQFVKTCLENVDALGNISKDLAVFKDYALSVCVPSIPFHPGAARALKEAGLWDDSFIVYGE